jgi:hypothetical protein
MAICYVIIVHHFGHQTTCFKYDNTTGIKKSKAMGKQEINDLCAEFEFRMDRFYFILEGVLLCVIQSIWYLVARKLTDMETLMKLFHEFAMQRLHDIDKIKTYVQSYNTLKNTIKTTFVQMLATQPENSLMQTILRMNEQTRQVCWLYFTKLCFQIIVDVFFIVFSCIYIVEHKDATYMCADQIRSYDPSAVGSYCMTPYANFSLILHIINVAALFYLFLVLLVDVVYMFVNLLNPIEDFNATFFSLEMWLSNMNLKRNLGALAVIDLYGFPKNGKQLLSERLI